jgi:hypothetical protein
MAAKCWAIKTRMGDIALPTIRTTKRHCISDYMLLDGNRKVTWSKLKRWGWQCVQISIREG